jgi:hypothetical protein
LIFNDSFITAQITTQLTPLASVFSWNARFRMNWEREEEIGRQWWRTFSIPVAVYVGGWGFEEYFFYCISTSIDTKT